MTVSVVPPAVAALTAVVVAIGNAAVSFALIGATQAVEIENAAVAVIAAAFLIANSQHTTTPTVSNTVTVPRRPRKPAATARRTR